MTVRVDMAPDEADAEAHVLPSTVSRPALLRGGSDAQFRVLVHDLFTVANRMSMVRDHLGRRLGITGPQYSLLVAVAQFQGRDGVSVGDAAAALHVSRAFVATESGVLAKSGLVEKTPNRADRRSVLLRLTPRAVALVDELAEEIRQINDRFFGQLDPASFDALCAAAVAIVDGSSEVLSRVRQQ